LSYAQYEVIEMLAAEPKLHAGELGRRLRISRQAAHGLLAQLARADLVELLPRDGTSRGAWLTRRGRRRLAACRRALHGTERALTALPAGARRGLLQAMGAAETALAPRPQPWWLE
jgi:DNA-binding MarR family transcriptional regulator